MSEYYFYDETTGIFTGNFFSGPDHLEANTPPGLRVWEGPCDPLRQRVNIATGALEECLPPPAPDDDHEWNPEIRAWVLKPAVMERRIRRQLLQSRIDELERSQLRPMREWMRDQADQVARSRVLDIEAQVEPLREELQTL